VVICDIDFFKKVNDTYGHNAGDAVLQMVAATLQESVVGVATNLQNEAMDGAAFRWGGEEFIFLLPGKDAMQAKDIADRIRQAVEQKVCHFDGQDIRVTMSFGVQELDGARGVETNIEEADAKLYEAKTSGRNRVVC
ncbi:MAG: GGDEF domain-containing protein, partial [Lachnospiraceae bacterium]|nr:GGDEF domain-containing protein [Lachnospiraceae bacterium]